MVYVYCEGTNKRLAIPNGVTRKEAYNAPPIASPRAVKKLLWPITGYHHLGHTPSVGT